MTIQRPSTRVSRKRILIVEDSETQQEYYRQCLKDTYDLFWAVNATEALTQAFHKRPDLVLLDVNIEPPMPHVVDQNAQGVRYVSGLDVCRQLKKSILSNTPILILTSKNGLIPRIKGRFAHADEYLTKPISRADLREYVHKYLGNPKAELRLSMYGQESAAYSIKASLQSPNE